MRFTTPHGSVRWRLPWSWSAFDYRELCRLLWDQCSGARFETAKVEGRATGGVRTDRGTLSARSSSTRWAGGGSWPARATSRRTRRSRAASRSTRSGGGEDLDVWIDRSLVRRGYAWSVPAGGEQRVGVGSYDPRQHVKEPTGDLAARLGVDAVRYQGNWFPHRLRPAAEDGVFFAGDSAGHCFRCRARGSAPRSTSASPAGGSCVASSPASARARRRSSATRRSAPATRPPSASRCASSG